MGYDNILFRPWGLLEPVICPEAPELLELDEVDFRQICFNVGGIVDTLDTG
jgi:hypothetical protein